MSNTVIHKFLDYVKTHPDHAAICVNDVCYSYLELYNIACQLLTLLQEVSINNNYCAILSDRTINNYVTIISILLSAKTYVPINPKCTIQRNLMIIQIANPGVVFIDIDNHGYISAFLTQLSPTKIIFFQKDIYTKFSRCFHKHAIYLFSYHPPNEYQSKLLPSPPSDQSYAYLMFTSGTTGNPKCVAIKHSNLNRYVESILSLFKPNSRHRFSQYTELTFDLSIHDIFVCWCSGATLVVMVDNEYYKICRFIQKYQITHWLSVPSTISALKQLGHLKPNNFPSLEVSFFCGEAFSQTQAIQWQRAAVNSKIINLYGPTEATIAFTYFQWRSEDSLQQPPIVPIGRPLPHQCAVMIDSKSNQICNNQNGQKGILTITGDQVVSCYWGSNHNTSNSFRRLEINNEYPIWYVTGDLVYWSTRWGYLYIGRIDDQWQICGHRIEKTDAEIELQKIASTASLVVLPIRKSKHVISGLIACICGQYNKAQFFKIARETLPSIMVPKMIIELNEFPKNSNGKIDYHALQLIYRKKCYEQ